MELVRPGASTKKKRRDVATLFKESQVPLVIFFRRGERGEEFFRHWFLEVRF